jgi:hypothetical protein
MLAHIRYQLKRRCGATARAATHLSLVTWHNGAFLAADRNPCGTYGEVLYRFQVHLNRKESRGSGPSEGLAAGQ